MRKKMLILATICLMLGLSGCGSTKINLNNYVDIEVSGYDSLGKATYTFDYEQFVEDYSDKIKVKKSNEEIRMEEAFGFEPVEILKDTCISYESGEMFNISNGDELVFSWKCDKDAAKEYFGCELQFEDIKYTVSELQEVEGFDPFENITVKFTGTAPQAKLEYTVDYSNPEMQDIIFNVENNFGFDIGEDVKITAQITPFLTPEAFVEKHNMLPNKSEKTYTVEDVPYYLKAPDDISQEDRDKITNEFIQYYKHYVDDVWDRPETLKEIEYVGNYFLKRRDDSVWIHNFYYQVYKISAELPDTKEPVEYYGYIYYQDIKTDGENIEFGDGISLDTGWFSDEEITFGNYVYIGYKSLDDIRMRHIESKLDGFEFIESLN